MSDHAAPKRVSHGLLVAGTPDDWREAADWLMKQDELPRTLEYVETALIFWLGSHGFRREYHVVIDNSPSAPGEPGEAN